MRFTPYQYQKAIADLQDGATQLEPDGHCCSICGDNSHQAWECHFNPLKAMVWCEAIHEQADIFHDWLHEQEQDPKVIEEKAHHFLHWLTGQITMSPMDRGCFSVLPQENLPWPKDWPPHHNTHLGEPCDMLTGPCSCGGWHLEKEFELKEDGLYRNGEKVDERAPIPPVL